MKEVEITGGYELQYSPATTFGNSLQPGLDFIILVLVMQCCQHDGDKSSDTESQYQSH